MLIFETCLCAKTRESGGGRYAGRYADLRFLNTLEIFFRFRRDRVGKRNVAGGFEGADIRAVFVLDSEKNPDASSRTFGKSYQKGDDGAMSKISCVDSIKYPVETEDRVKEHSCVIVVRIFVTANISKEFLIRMRLEERPIH